MGKSKTTVVKTEVTKVSIEVPTVAPSETDYMARYVRVDNRSLSLSQRMGLAKLTNGLKAINAKLANGRDVQNKTDSIRWMLEQIH